MHGKPQIPKALNNIYNKLKVSDYLEIVQNPTFQNKASLLCENCFLFIVEPMYQIYIYIYIYRLFAGNPMEYIKEESFLGSGRLNPEKLLFRRELTMQNVSRRNDSECGCGKDHSLEKSFNSRILDSTLLSSTNLEKSKSTLRIKPKNEVLIHDGNTSYISQESNYSTILPRKTIQKFQGFSYTKPNCLRNKTRKSFTVENIQLNNIKNKEQGLISANKSSKTNEVTTITKPPRAPRLGKCMSAPYLKELNLAKRNLARKDSIDLMTEYGSEEDLSPEPVVRQLSKFHTQELTPEIDADEKNISELLEEYDIIVKKEKELIEDKEDENKENKELKEDKQKIKKVSAREGNVNNLNRPQTECSRHKINKIKELRNIGTFMQATKCSKSRKKHIMAENFIRFREKAIRPGTQLSGRLNLLRNGFNKNNTRTNPSSPVLHPSASLDIITRPEEEGPLPAMVPKWVIKPAKEEKGGKSWGKFQRIWGQTQDLPRIGAADNIEEMEGVNSREGVNSVNIYKSEPLSPLLSKYSRGEIYQPPKPQRMSHIQVNSHIQALCVEKLYSDKVKRGKLKIRNASKYKAVPKRGDGLNTKSLIPNVPNIEVPGGGTLDFSASALDIDNQPLSHSNLSIPPEDTLNNDISLNHHNNTRVDPQNIIFPNQ